MNAPQHFPTPSGVHDVRLSAQDAHLRLKLFNKDNVLEQRLARAWGLAGEIIPTVAQQFWEGVRRHPRSAISSEPDAVKRLVDIEIHKYTMPPNAGWVDQLARVARQGNDTRPAWCRARVWQYIKITGVAVLLKKKKQ